MDTIAALYQALDAGEVGPGHVVYVSPELYAGLCYPEQVRVRARVERARARLVTDLPTYPAISVSRASGPGAVRPSVDDAAGCDVETPGTLRGA